MGLDRAHIAQTGNQYHRADIEVVPSRKAQKWSAKKHMATETTKMGYT